METPQYKFGEKSVKNKKREKEKEKGRAVQRDHLSQKFWRTPIPPPQKNIHLEYFLFTFYSTEVEKKLSNMVDPFKFQN